MDRLTRALENTPEPEPIRLEGYQRRLRKVEDPPAYVQPDWESLDDFRKVVAEELRAYMMTPSPDYMLLIQAPPGSGKTYAGVDFAHWALENAQGKKSRILYAGPRLDFFADVCNTSVEQEKNVDDWYMWLSRKESDDPQVHTCHHAVNYGKWVSSGYEGWKYCDSVCGKDYMKNECIYLSQEKIPNPLIYGNHMHVTLGHMFADQFAVIIGDEWPLAAVEHHWTLPAGQVQLTEVPYDDALAPVIHELNKLCGLKPAHLDGPALLDALGGAAAIDEALDDATMAKYVLEVSKFATPTLPSDGDTSRIPARFLPVLLPILKREVEAALAGHEYPARISVSAAGLTMDTRRTISPAIKTNHLVWFDATGTKAMYEALFQREVRVVTCEPRPVGKIYQVTNRGNGKSDMMLRKDGELTSNGQLDPRSVDQLRAQVEHIVKDYANPGIVTHKALKDEFKILTNWFYAARGTNEMKNCDVLIVAGTPNVPPSTILATAKCLWPDRMRPFDDRETTVERLYNYITPDGMGVTYPVVQFMDPALNLVKDQVREAEIFQAAHRSRMLFRDTPVYLLTNIPIDRLRPYKLLTLAELMGTPDGVPVFNWANVVRVADSFADQGRLLTITDLMASLNVSRNTASKYWDLFLESGEWEETKALRKIGARGPSPRALTKIK